MAETTITLSDENGESSLLTEGVDTTDTGTAQTGAAGASQADRERIAELERLHGRYREQLAGWDRHSRELTTELQTTRERLARLEGISQASPGQPRIEERRFAPGQLKSALTKWLNNEEADLDAVEQALGRSLESSQDQTQPLKPDDLKRIIREELVELGTKGNVQSIVGQNHPDLQDPRSQLSQRVWEGYDTYSTDPKTQLMVQKDARFEVPMIGPDGSQRMVDARIVDRFAADLRLRGAVQEGRRQEQHSSTVGSVMTGNGQTTRTNSQRSVEAMALLSQAEIEYLSSPKTQRSWSKLPKDIKEAAKYYYDGLSSDEKSRRLAAYRSRAGVSV